MIFGRNPFQIPEIIEEFQESSTSLLIPSFSSLSRSLLKSLLAAHHPEPPGRPSLIAALAASSPGA
jgi:hypothetical protein